MKTHQSAAMQTLIITLMLLTSACNPLSSAMDTDPQIESVKSYSAAEVEAKYRQNPSPQQRYDIMMTIENAPGPFELVRWSAQYEAPECIYTMSKFAGVHSRPHTAINVDFKKMNETTYVGSVYLDAMLDEDYFGNGACIWRMTFFNVSLMATGTNLETRFLASISEKTVTSKEKTIVYYAKIRYPRSQMDNFTDSGHTDINRYKPEIRNDVFSINLMPSKP